MINWLKFGQSPLENGDGALDKEATGHDDLLIVFG